MKHGDCSVAFPHLSKFIFSLLCLPHWRAAVERIFSSISALKTKQRNKLSASTLAGNLHTLDGWHGRTHPPCSPFLLLVKVFSNCFPAMASASHITEGGKKCMVAYAHQVVQIKHFSRSTNSLYWSLCQGSTVVWFRGIVHKVALFLNKPFEQLAGAWRMKWPL